MSHSTAAELATVPTRTFSSGVTQGPAPVSFVSEILHHGQEGMG